MDKSKKITIGLYALSIFLILDISYAYFSLNIIGNDTAKLSVISSGTLELTYSDTNEITLNNAVPGDSFQKEISVKNTGTLDTMYNIIWQELTNEFVRNEIVISATCERLNSEGVVDGTCNNIEERPVGRLSIPQKISIEPNITHKYTVTVKFIDTGKNQNYNQSKTFNGKLGIEEYKDNTPEATYCTFYEELTEGAEYINGQYTYRYKQECAYTASSDLAWRSINTDGWGVQLTDKTSTDAVTSKFCTYINDKPVVSMSYMFYKSQATSIDLSSFNTSKVTDMDGMFYSSQATTIDLSSFDTSNVTDMYAMFINSQATALDVSNFNTSKVTNMRYMFYGSQATSIDLSSFDTSKVTNMNCMFFSSKATTLDLSSFDTSNVTGMINMFSNSNNLKTIYASNKFNTDAVTDSASMFSSCTSLVGGAGTTYKGSTTDKTYARIDGGTRNPGYFTTK